MHYQHYAAAPSYPPASAAMHPGSRLVGHHGVAQPPLQGNPAAIPVSVGLNGGAGSVSIMPAASPAYCGGPAGYPAVGDRPPGSNFGPAPAAPAAWRPVGPAQSSVAYVGPQHPPQSGFPQHGHTQSGLTAQMQLGKPAMPVTLGSALPAGAPGAPFAGMGPPASAMLPSAACGCNAGPGGCAGGRQLLSNISEVPSQEHRRMSSLSPRPSAVEEQSSPTYAPHTRLEPTPGRSARRAALCEQAFSWVDGCRTGHLSMSQNKTGLTLVFEQLGDVPMPKDAWYVKVHRNYADEQGLITLHDFMDIVQQWDEHNLNKRLNSDQGGLSGGAALGPVSGGSQPSSAGGCLPSGAVPASTAQEAASHWQPASVQPLSSSPPAQAAPTAGPGDAAGAVGPQTRPHTHARVRSDPPLQPLQPSTAAVAASGAPPPRTAAPQQPAAAPQRGSSELQALAVGSRAESVGAGHRVEFIGPEWARGDLDIAWGQAGTVRTVAGDNSLIVTFDNGQEGRIDVDHLRAASELQPSAALAAPQCSSADPGFSHTRQASVDAPAPTPSNRPAGAVKGAGNAHDAGAVSSQLDRTASRFTGESARSAAAEIASDVMFPTYAGRLAIFDDYEFLGDVGSGSFGKVMVVKHRETQKLRACKVMTVQTALQRELTDTEIKLLKSLNHPNIMKLFEVYFENGSKDRVTSGNIYLVTELCEGGDLFSRILHHYERLKQPMTESHVAFMMQQILSATKYCHDRGIVHRDIKPENILFVDRSPNSLLKIIDFGLANFTGKIQATAKEVKIPRSGALGRLAKMLPKVGGKSLIPQHERKRVMQRAGTAHYMAPEMIEGSYNEKADLFSIGIIFCQLLTGWHPFYVPQMDDEQSVRAKISSPEPLQFPRDLVERISKEAHDLCCKLLEKSAAKRYNAGQALEHAWFRDPSKASPYGNVEVLSASIFEGLQKYQTYNKLKRAVLQLLTRELSEREIQELRSKFMALDTEGDGLLSPAELVEGMRHVGYNMGPDELARLVAALDGSGSQRIGYKEFISALIERRVQFDRQQLRECFKKLDRNQTGRISYEDVRQILRKGITESEWQEITAVGTGDRFELTFEEFAALMEADGDI